MTSRAICKSLAAAALGLAGLAATGAAQAGVSWHIGINLPGPAVYYQPSPVYAPAPVYYEPPPVYYQLPPVVYRPAPVYYQPAPVYVQPQSRAYWHDDREYRRYDGHRGHHGRRHGDDHDRDDDRRAYRHGPDRNGDGIPDRYRY